MESYKQELDVIIANVNQAIQSQNRKQLIWMANQFKEHMNELSDDIKRLKDNVRKMKRLEYDLEEVLDNVDNLQIKLDAETSSPNPNHQKIMNYTDQKEELNKKQKTVDVKIKKMHKTSASIVNDTETLEIKSEKLQEYGNLLQRIKDTLNEQEINIKQA